MWSVDVACPHNADSLTCTLWTGRKIPLLVSCTFLCLPAQMAAASHSAFLLILGAQSRLGRCPPVSLLFGLYEQPHMEQIHRAYKNQMASRAHTLGCVFEPLDAFPCRMWWWFLICHCSLNTSRIHPQLVSSLQRDGRHMTSTGGLIRKPFCLTFSLSWSFTTSHPTSL